MFDEERIRENVSKRQRIRANIQFPYSNLPSDNVGLIFINDTDVSQVFTHNMPLIDYVWNLYEHDSEEVQYFKSIGIKMFLPDDELEKLDEETQEEQSQGSSELDDEMLDLFMKSTIDFKSKIEGLIDENGEVLEGVKEYIDSLKNNFFNTAPDLIVRLIKRIQYLQQKKESK